jgi:hypothetical protein
MSVTLGLLLVFSGPPMADPDMAPPTAAPAPTTSTAPGPTTPAAPRGTPGPSASGDVAPTPDAAPPPAGDASEPAMTASPSDPDAEPSVGDASIASGPDESAGSSRHLLRPGEGQTLRDPFDANPSDPAEMVGWMGYQTRAGDPLPPPPPPPAPQQTRRRLFIGGYGGPSARMSSVSRKLSTLTGFRGGVLIGERLSFGAAAYRLTYRHNSQIAGPDGDRYSLRMGYGGMTFGLTLWRPGRFEFAVEGLVGAGSACVSDSHRYSDDDYRCIETVRMFVGEPAATMYVNVTNWMRLAVTAGYRVVVRERWQPPNNFLLSGGFGGIDLQFGWFKKPPRR